MDRTGGPGGHGDRGRGPPPERGPEHRGECDQDSRRTGTLEFIGIALLTESLFVLGMTIPTFTGLFLRLPREEAALAERFGEAWHTYTEGTGRFVPPVLARQTGQE